MIQGEEIPFSVWLGIKPKKINGKKHTKIKGKMDLNYQSVTNQAGIFAGEDGYEAEYAYNYIIDSKGCERVNEEIKIERNRKLLQIAI